MDPRYIYKPEEYNCQMNEVVSSRCKRNERAKRAHPLYIIMARELWIGRYTNYPDKQAGVLARDFLQESQILIFAACSHFQLITGLRFFRWAFMVGLIERVTAGTSPLRLGHHSCFTMS